VATRRTRRAATTLAILILASITLLALDGQGSGSVTSSLRSLGSTILSPVVSVVNLVTRPIGNFFAGAINYGSVSEENARLRATVGRLEAAGATRPFDRQQLVDLLALQHLPYLSSLPTVTSQTTAVDVSNFAATIQINKGSSEGISVGMPVVGSGGLVGQVVTTTASSSSVRLITDGRTRIGVVMGGSSTLGVVSGQAAGRPLEVDFVSPNTVIPAGRMFFTNGLQGAQFPSGIPVGRVLSATTPVNSTQMAISLRPAANLSHLGFVDVVLWEPQA